MANTPPSDIELLSQFDHAFDDLDKGRMEALETAKNLLALKHKALEKEKERLKKKYGAQHSKLARIEVRLQYDEQMFRSLDAEIIHTGQKAERPSATAWRVHGMVLDARGERQQGLTVVFSDSQQQQIRELPQACTDKQGYYALTLQQEQVAKYKDADLFVTVYRKEKGKPFIDAVPFRAVLGDIQYRDILLPEIFCDPPPENREDPIA